MIPYKLSYNYKDLFKSPRIALSGKKIWVFLVANLFGYASYWLATYIAILISGIPAKELLTIHGLYPSIQGFIGVDSINNHSDPSAFDNQNDLNIENAGTMHWGWNTGYIFIKIEGKVDTLSTGTFDHNFSFHAGTDAFLQQLTFENILWEQTGQNEHTMNISLSMSDFLNSDFNTIDLKDEFITHSNSGQQTLTEKVVTNFVNALSLQ